MSAQVISLQKYKDDCATRNAATILTVFFPFLVWAAIWLLVWW